jgi:TonB family protein
MTPRFSLMIATGLLFAVAVACSNPLSRFTKQYKCQIPGKPEPQTANEYIRRASEHSYERIPPEIECSLGACSEAIRLEPKNALAYHCRANVLRVLNKPEAALKDFQIAIQLDPNEPWYYESRSVLYRETGDIAHALEDLNTAIRIAPDDRRLSTAYAERGKFFQTQRKLDESIQDYTTAIRLQPDFAWHYASRGDVYFEKGDYQQAVKDYTEAIRIDPKTDNFYADRSKAYDKLGQSVLAIADDVNARRVKAGDSPDFALHPSPGVAPRAPISGGVLNGKAINLPQPAYPPIARQAHASGTVVVRVVVDENGSVIFAETVSGHPLLRAVSISAARGAKFPPTKLSGVPVKVTGTLIYTFTAQ